MPRLPRSLHRMPLTAFFLFLAVSLCTQTAIPSPRRDATHSQRAMVATPPVTAEARAKLLAAARDSSLPEWQRGYMETLAARGAKREPAPRGQAASPDRPETLSGCSDRALLFPNSEALARAQMGAVYDPVRDRMVLFGGFSNDNQNRNDVWALSLVGTPTWSLLAPTGEPPSPRRSFSAIYDSARDRIVFFGGTTDTDYRTNEVWSLTLVAPAWTQLVPAGTAPEARVDATAIYDATRDRMILFGGEGYTDLLGDTWAVQFGGTNSWVQLAPSGALPVGRTQHSAVFDAPRDRMIVFGGQDGFAGSNAVWSLALSGSTTWTELTPTGTLPAAHAQHSAVFDAPRNRMLVYGGSVPGLGDSNELWSLALTGALKWTKLEPSGAPQGNSYCAAIYDPVRQRLVVFGGYGAMDEAWAVPLTGGGPAWTQLAVAGQPPLQRDRQTAIYDAPRQRMVVFGGVGTSVAPKSDVWGFSLSWTPAWTLVVPTGTRPAGRFGHAAIFDASRNRMVIFGGHDGLNALNDVWALSLSGTPAWTRLNPSGTPPVPRESAAAIYDAPRDRMVIFGGRGFNDAWSLSFSGGGTWTALAPSGTPPAAVYHASGVFDPVRNRMLCYGAGSDPRVWALSLSGPAAWTPLSGAGVAPSGESVAQIVYDVPRDRVLMMGESCQLFAFSLGASPEWSEFGDSGAVPDPREWFTMIYDTANSRAVVHGGVAGSWYNDVIAFSFPANRFSVNTAAEPEIGGTVTRNPDQACFTGGTTVALTAVANAGYGFANWSGDASGTANPLAVTVGAEKNITANFVAYALATDAAPTGSGTIARDPDQPTYAPGSSVVLTAIADQGFPFTNWSGDATGSTNPLSVVMDRPKNIVANFAVTPVPCGTWALKAEFDLRPDGPMVYDPVRKRMLLYDTYITPGGAAAVAIWQLPMNSFIWSMLAIQGTAPNPRAFVRIIYDPVGDRLMLFGGDGTGTDGSNGPQTDLWEVTLSGTPTWGEVATTGTRPRRVVESSFVYDRARKRALLFGGLLPADDYQFPTDTWELSMATPVPNWSVISVPSAPPGRAMHSAFYDSLLDRMVIAGGGRSDCWALDFSGPAPQWQQLFPAGGSLLETGSCDWDPVRRRMLMVASGAAYALVFKHGPAWARLENQPSGPTLRNGEPFAYDRDRDQFILIDNDSNSNGRLGTWRLAGGGHPLDIVRESPYGGTVTRDPPAACYDPGTHVTLTAVPGRGYTFAGWDGDATGNVNPLSIVMDELKVITARFDVSTATLLAHFDAVWIADGIEIRWRFGTPERILSVTLERAEAVDGPWIATSLATRDDNGTRIGVDAVVEPRLDYFYRLMATLSDGSRIVFGPISTRAGERISESALTQLSPNPTAGSTQVQFAVARAGRVRLTVVDVSGRVVATLVDEVHRAGRYTAAWDGATAAGKVPAGVYYIRLVASDRHVVRRLAMIR